MTDLGVHGCEDGMLPGGAYEIFDEDVFFSWMYGAYKCALYLHERVHPN